MATKRQLSLEIELKCSSDGSQTKKTLSFAPIPESVAGIKQRIENELSIPMFSQSVSLPDGQTLLDSQQIAGLYLRNGDTLQVAFFAKADVEQLRRGIDRSLRPSLELLRANSSLKDAKLIQKNRDFEALLASCQSCLHGVTFQSLLPWNQARTEANRRFLIHEGRAGHRPSTVRHSTSPSLGLDGATRYKTWRSAAFHSCGTFLKRHMQENLSWTREALT